MKIEICESLAQSWLKHVMNCQVVQLNWKANTKQLHETELALEIYKAATGQIAGGDAALFRSIGKASQTPEKQLSQMLRQAEIDAFGVKLTPGTNGMLVTELFAVDVAFHVNGLGYGGKAKTTDTALPSGYDNISKVTMKMVRSALALLTGFAAHQGRIVFASPVVGGKDYKKLEAAFAEATALFERFGLHYEFELIANSMFDSQLLAPTIDATRGTTDTAELFMRSVQLLELFPKALATTAAVSEKRVRKAAAKAVLPDETTALPLGELWRRVRREPAAENELKIGAALQLVMEHLDQNDQQFAALQQVLAAGDKLRMGNELTVFRPYTPADDLSLRRKDNKGYNRYYSTPLARHQVLFSSQWHYDKHFAEWTRLFEAAGLL